jgi:hypothetical protein
VIAIGVNPTGEFDFLSDIGFAELAGGVGTITCRDSFHGLVSWPE